MQLIYYLISSGSLHRVYKGHLAYLEIIPRFNIGVHNVNKAKERKLNNLFDKVLKERKTKGLLTVIKQVISKRDKSVRNILGTSKSSRERNSFI